MLLHFTSVDKQTHVREFICWLGTLEDSFDFLSRVVAQGDTLLTAHMLDDCQRTALPLAAFDGSPLLEVLRELEQEWQAILSESCDEAVPPDAELIHLIQQRIHQYEVSIASHERMISYSTKWLQRTQDSCSFGPKRDNLISQYVLMIQRYQQQLIKAQCRSNLAAKRLSQLVA